MAEDIHAMCEAWVQSCVSQTNKNPTLMELKSPKVNYYRSQSHLDLKIIRLSYSLGSSSFPQNRSSFSYCYLRFSSTVPNRKGNEKT